MEENRPETYEKYIKALTDISQAITSDRYLEDILKLIVMVTAKVTGVEICSLWLIDESADPQKIRLKATQAIAPDYLKDRSLALDEGVVGFVATHNQPLIIRDVSTEPRFKEIINLYQKHLVEFSVQLSQHAERIFKEARDD